MNRQDSLQMRQDNGKAVCQTLREIGEPATFGQIKANLLTKLDEDVDPRTVSTEIKKVLQKGVNNGFLYKAGVKYCIEPPEDKAAAKRTRSRSSHSDAKKPERSRSRTGPQAKKSKTDTSRKARSPQLPARKSNSRALVAKPKTRKTK